MYHISIVCLVLSPKGYTAYTHNKYHSIYSLTHNNLKVTFSQRWTDQPTNQRTDGQTTRLLELLRAAKNLKLYIYFKYIHEKL